MASDVDGKGWFDMLSAFKRDHPDLCRQCIEANKNTTWPGILCGTSKFCKMLTSKVDRASSIGGSQ